LLIFQASALLELKPFNLKSRKAADWIETLQDFGERMSP